MRPAVLALPFVVLGGCCPCLGPEDGPPPPPLTEPAVQEPSAPPPPPLPPHQSPESPSEPEAECEWFYEVMYACTDLPDEPIEPCLEEEGAICDGRLQGAVPVDVQLGPGFGCALFDTGQVKCWGENRCGLLGLGHDAPRGKPEEMGDALRFVDLGAGETVAELSAGGSHVCALMHSGRVKCWGCNSEGELGLGDTVHRGDHRGEMGDRLPHVDAGHQRVVHIAAAHERTCAVLADGAVRCWGEDGWGYLGRGSVYQSQGDEPGEMGSRLIPVDLGPDQPPIVSLHTYGRSTCALFENRRIKCWGSNTHGQLGQGHDDHIGDDPEDLGAALPYVELGGDSRVRALALGHRFACAALEQGGTKCWGELHGGRLGRPGGPSEGLGDNRGEMGDALPEVDLGRPDDPIQLVAGFDAACALFADGWIKCWGENFLRQLGNGDDESRGDDLGEMGEALPYVILGRPAVQLFGGSQSFCAWTDDDELWCWGSRMEWMRDPDADDDTGPAIRIDLGSRETER